jgi:diguanylate cyclase (GGDEF)-like protein
MGETRILVVDDDPAVRQMLAEYLSAHGYQVGQAASGAAMRAELERAVPAVVLLDIGLPGEDGLTLARYLRERHDVAIIMVTGAGDVVDRVAGLEVGADDYIAKPFDPPELVARVSSVLRRNRQMRELSPLTGMPGNFQISYELDRLVNDPEARWAVIYADLDNFKAYNDTYGFLRGDEAIKATARLLTQALARHPSSPQFAGHVGGDDFVLIVGADDVEALARDILSSFDDLAPTLYDEHDAAAGYIEVKDRQGTMHRFPLMTISLGIATTSHRRIASQWEASAIATEMKLLAKRTPGSNYELDRRRT